MPKTEDRARLPSIDKETRNEFKSWVKQEFGGVHGHYPDAIENALREYMKASEGGDTHDRLRRLENTVERIDERVGHLCDDESGKKKKGSDVSLGPRRRKKLDAIESQIEREAGDTTRVHESVINGAIEDNAGSSGPTLRRYKEMLKHRHIAFENPSGGTTTWYVDAETFVKVVESNFPHMNSDIASEYGEEWYAEAVDEYVDFRDEEGPKGFQ